MGLLWSPRLRIESRRLGRLPASGTDVWYMSAAVRPHEMRSNRDCPQIGTVVTRIREYTSRRYKVITGSEQLGS